MPQAFFKRLKIFFLYKYYNNMSIPKLLQYGSKTEGASARSLRTNIQPQNGSGNYTANDTITINIPTRSNLVMVPTESYLKFRLTITNSTGGNCSYRFDSCGAHSLIQRIRVWHGSNLCEDIDNYNMLAKMLFDLQMPSDSVYNKFNVLSGTRSDLTVRGIGTSAYADVAGINGAFNNGDLTATQTNSGDLISRNLANNGTVSRDLCVNLISLVGSLCQNFYLPLFACQSAPLRVEIQLVSNLANALAATATGSTFQISNCEYVANFIELNDDAMSIILGSLQGKPLQFVVPEYRNFANTITGLPNNATSNSSVAIPAKFSSLKSLLVAQRTGTTAGNLLFPLSSIVNGLSSYQFRIGAQVRPSKAPDNIPEIFSETLKSIGSIGDLGYTPAVDLASFSLNNNTAMGAGDSQLNTQSSGSFFVGIDLENFPNANKDTIFAGYNSNTDDIFYQPTFSNAPNANIRVDAYALYDNLLVFENGTAYCKF